MITRLDHTKKVFMYSIVLTAAMRELRAASEEFLASMYMYVYVCIFMYNTHTDDMKIRNDAIYIYISYICIYVYL